MVAPDNLLNVATKIKAPLTLTALAIIVFYLVLRQVLALDIFVSLTSATTYKLVGSLLDKVFWLALVSLLVGALLYVFSIYVEKKSTTAPAVTLLDARVNEQLSPYQAEKSDHQKIGPKER